MDRVEEFLGDRLRGMPVPADLRRLVELQLDGQLDRVAPFWEVRVLSPGEVHSLQEPYVPAEGDPRAAKQHANNRAYADVLAHLVPVVDGFNGDLWGYWLHPDEDPELPPPIVKLDTEGQFSIEQGTSLVDAMVFDWAEDEDLAEIAEFCDRVGLPLLARSHEELGWRAAAVSPGVLHESRYKRYYPYHVRPDWADAAAPDAAAPDAEDPLAAPPIGVRADDPRVVRALARHGVTGLDERIAEADNGEGQALLPAPDCSAAFEFLRETDTAWFLATMRFYRGRDDRPLCTQVPFGFVLSENHEQAHARFGDPTWRSVIGPIESWDFGDVKLHVTFDDDGAPITVRCAAVRELY